jgi:hypothetical protein
MLFTTRLIELQRLASISWLIGFGRLGGQRREATRREDALKRSEGENQPRRQEARWWPYGGCALQVSGHRRAQRALLVRPGSPGSRLARLPGEGGQYVKTSNTQIFPRPPYH